MTTETSDEMPTYEHVLHLYPPKLPDSNTQVTGADCGIAMRFYGSSGAKVIVDPYLQQAPLDTVQLNLNGEMNIASTQTTASDDAVVLFIPPNKLRSDPGYLNELSYTVIRGSNIEGTSQPPLSILYNDVPPGMKDQNEGVGGHSELKMDLPADVLEDGIDADRAEQGVQIFFSYPYCRSGDRILLSCKGRDIFHDVLPHEAPAQPTDVPTRIGLLLEKEVFELAGDDPRFPFKFTVSDEIGNATDRNSWSPVITADVDLRSRMAAPDVTENPDDPNDAPDTIDLNKLGNKDLTVQVHVIAPLWQMMDSIRVTYVATQGNGETVEHKEAATVERVPFIHKLLIPNAKVVADSLVKVTYEQVRNDISIARSKITRARVVVRPVITSVKNSVGAELQNGGTVSDNKVTLAGSALAEVLLQIFDGDTYIADVQAGADYKWQSNAIPIGVGQRIFKVKEKSSSQLESEPWFVERLAFDIDRTQMKLNGLSIKVPQWPKTGLDSIGNTAVRLPTGGVPPYDYASSDPLTVLVTTGGKVTGLKQGVATIYVTDQEGTTLSYLVAATNIFRLMISKEPLRADDAVLWMNELGGQNVFNYQFIRDALRVYVPSVPAHINTCAYDGRSYWYMRADWSHFGWIKQLTLLSWCLVPY